MTRAPPDILIFLVIRSSMESPTSGSAGRLVALPLPGLSCLSLTGEDRTYSEANLQSKKGLAATFANLPAIVSSLEAELAV